MNAISISSILSPPNTSTRLSLSSYSSFKSSSSHPQSHFLTLTLGFCVPRALPAPSPNSLRLRVSSKSRSSAFSVEREVSDADDEYDEDEDEDEDEDDDVTADEYDDFSGDESEVVNRSDDEIEFSVAVAEALPSRTEEFKWQRVQKLCNEVREFGEEIIDVDELAFVYDFRIDKFTVLPL